MTLTPYPWQAPQWQRLMQQRDGARLAHAYLLVGERGLGKKHFARSAAALLLCAADRAGQACGECRSCKLLVAGSNPDLLVVEPEDSKVIKVDQVRQLTEFASRTSHSNSRKVIVLHKADALNIAAANALLKTLEEPPGATVLLLVTDNPGRLLATIRSRCQRILFPVPDSGTARAWLQSQSGGADGLEEVLVQAANRPLLALELLASDERHERESVLRALAAMLEGRVDPVEFAATGKTLGVDKIMEWLWQATFQLARLMVCELAPASAGKEIARIADVLTGSRRSGDELLGRIMGINRAAEEARQQLAGPSNPNAQLMLESILWRWSRLAA